MEKDLSKKDMNMSEKEFKALERALRLADESKGESEILAELSDVTTAARADIMDDLALVRWVAEEGKHIPVPPQALERTLAKIDLQPKLFPAVPKKEEKKNKPAGNALPQAAVAAAPAAVVAASQPQASSAETKAKADHFASASRRTVEMPSRGGQAPGSVPSLSTRGDSLASFLSPYIQSVRSNWRIWAPVGLVALAAISFGAGWRPFGAAVTPSATDSSIASSAVSGQDIWSASGTASSFASEASATRPSFAAATGTKSGVLAMKAVPLAVPMSASLSAPSEGTSTRSFVVGSDTLAFISQASQKEKDALGGSDSKLAAASASELGGLAGSFDETQVQSCGALSSFSDAAQKELAARRTALADNLSLNDASFSISEQSKGLLVSEARQYESDLFTAILTAYGAKVADFTERNALAEFRKAAGDTVGIRRDSYDAAISTYDTGTQSALTTEAQLISDASSRFLASVNAAFSTATSQGCTDASLSGLRSALSAAKTRLASDAKTAGQAGAKIDALAVRRKASLRQADYDFNGAFKAALKNLHASGL